MRGTPNTSRRHALFAAASSVVIGSGITAGAAASVADFVPSHPDADLISLCARAEAADDRSSAIMDTVEDMDPSDPRWSPATDESSRVFAECRKDMDRAAKVRAATLDGLRAKASLALREMAPDDFEDCPLVLSVLNQLAGRT